MYARLTCRFLQGGGEVVDKLPDKHKELAEVLPLAFFEEQMRGMREGLRKLRADVWASMLNDSKPAEPVKQEPKSAQQSLLAGKSMSKLDAGEYSAGNAAVAEALKKVKQRRYNAPSLKELMRQQEELRTGIKRADKEEAPKPLARSNYLMSKQLEGFPGVVKDDEYEATEMHEEGEHGQDSAVADAVRKMNAEIEQRLSAAAEEIDREDKRQQEGKGYEHHIYMCTYLHTHT